MVFAVTESQTMLADMLLRLFKDENGFEERRRRLGGDAPEVMALWPSLASQGVLGATFPEEAGGFGGSIRDLTVVMAEIGRSLAVEPILTTALCGRILQGAGQDVSALISGEELFALAHEEGADPFAPLSTQATSSTDGHRLSGVKLAVRHADRAQYFIVSAALNEGSACFLVERDAPGVIVEGYRLIDGSWAATLQLSNAPGRYLADGQALQDALDWWMVALGAETVGIVSALNAATFAYLQTRRQFDLPLASFQALQHRAADMASAAEEARVLTERAIIAIEEGAADRSALASAVKSLTDEAGRLVGHEAVQLHGGMGVSDELNVSHYMRRLAAIRAECGSADVHVARYGAQGAQLVQETAFRAEVRAFVRAHLPDDLARKGALGLEIEKADYVRWQKILFEKGWFGAAWPKQFGGGGWSLDKQLIFAQEAALNNAPMIIPYGVNMVGPVIYTFGNDIQRARYLPDILSSDTWWCQGYSEPNAGSDLASLKTTAVRDGDHYVVNGAKMWTTEAQWADMMHCLVRTDPDVKPQRGISFLLIDMKTPGLTIRPIITIDGQHHTNQVFFDDVRVPAENLVGEEGQGWSIAKFLLSNERVAIADTGAKLRLLKAIKDLFGSLPFSAHKARLGDKLASAEIQMLTLCALEETYVKQWAEGGPRDGPEASILKIRGTEILQRLSEIALEVEGPLGGAHDPRDLHRAPDMNFTAAQRASLMAHQYLYGRCWSIFGGTNEIQRNIIARSVLSP